jgi:hypothetical protein
MAAGGTPTCLVDFWAQRINEIVAEAKAKVSLVLERFGVVCEQGGFWKWAKLRCSMLARSSAPSSAPRTCARYHRHLLLHVHMQGEEPPKFTHYFDMGETVMDFLFASVSARLLFPPCQLY